MFYKRRVDKPPRLFIKLLLGFVSDSDLFQYFSNSIKAKPETSMLSNLDSKVGKL